MAQEVVEINHIDFTQPDPPAEPTIEEIWPEITGGLEQDDDGHELADK